VSPALHIRIAPRNTAHDQILYTEGVQAHWRETTVGEHGELVLEDLPFEPGQAVEVLVVSKTTGSTTAGGRSLRDSVLEFHEPFEPAASECGQSRDAPRTSLAKQEVLANMCHFWHNKI